MLSKARLIISEWKFDTKAFLLPQAEFQSIKYFHSLQMNANISQTLYYTNQDVLREGCGGVHGVSLCLSFSLAPQEAPLPATPECLA